MTAAFTIIDSFRIAEALKQRGIELPAGMWFVLEGTFLSTSALPRPGATVEIVTPSGEHLRASIAHADVRHGNGAVSFTPMHEHLPRLSRFSVTG